MQKTEWGLTLSTGKRLDFNGWAVCTFDGRGRLMFGYDGFVDIYKGLKYLEDEPLTPQEKQETALYMMQQWSQWAGGGFDIKINEIF